jgi:hypothetical protein
VILKNFGKFPKFSKDFDFFTIDFEKFGMDLEKSRFDGQNAQVFTCAKVATKAPRHKEGRFRVKFSHRGHKKYILGHRAHRAT